MLGSAGSIVPKRWILGIFALGLIAVMVATSANPWAGAATLPTNVTASAASSTSIQVNWTAVTAGSTIPGTGNVIDKYNIDCVPTTGGTISLIVTGIATATGTVHGLTADMAYVCTVKQQSGSTLPASGVAAASITTPSSAATTLGSAVANLTTASVQVGGTVQIYVNALGADVAKTAITTGFTVQWGVDNPNGSLSDSTGTAITYTASSEGSATVMVGVTQTASGTMKTDTITITNFAVAAAPAAEALVDPASSETPELPDVSGFEAGAAESAVLKPSSASTTLSVVDAGDSTVSGSVNFGAGAIPTNTSVGVLTSIGSATSATAPMPSGVTSVGSSILSISMTDKDGVPVGNSYRLNSDATVSMQLPMSTVTSAGADTQGLSIWKATTEAGPWTTLSSTVTNVDGVVQVTGQVRTLSVFRIGFETRGDVVGGEVLPSAGDAAPTTTQALLVTGLGLLLIVGGVYVRRQRRANGTV
jgi:hypothetical protein